VPTENVIRYTLCSLVQYKFKFNTCSNRMWFHWAETQYHIETCALHTNERFIVITRTTTVRSITSNCNIYLYKIVIKHNNIYIDHVVPVYMLNYRVTTVFCVLIVPRVLIVPLVWLRGISILFTVISCRTRIRCWMNWGGIQNHQMVLQSHWMSV